ncbi:MAG TPA: helix-turn-helix transcriptional regulator [Petrimonas sp.]|uniref:helix-turn-helix domain-containing protein n=1 Tax=Petrimonas sp. TaxID=2023866 RepID=UPI00095D3CB9|nr:helix-turn-helix transcriptional regulator [Petrimonas sp.]MEA4979203.1 helix-turn-helix transcriptional regulator [Petrimonas sp.]OJV35333.1 MAG: transcriptional regulator [Bacteroidia bacterium 43-41]HHV85150.1 helix-turn-helix transcriptional regulator [Petrimonas sp.]
MIAEATEKLNGSHTGHNVQKIRIFLGIEQEVLAAGLGISGQEVSEIEKQNRIEEGLLLRIADVLGVSSEIIRDFDVEKAIYNINSYKDATISEGATTTVYAALQQINPIEKIVELYERLLQSEREKIELLKNK